MSTETLRSLLEGNAAHVDSLDDDYFADVQEGQHPAVVSVCCSDSRVSQEGMWNVTRPGWLFTPSNIGNQAWDTTDGERVVNGNLLYPVAHTGTETIAVVGHTGCGAVTAAYQHVIDAADAAAQPDGIRKWVESLVPVVETGLDSEGVDADAAAGAVVNQLVEYNVDRQVSFLRDAPEIDEDVSVYGFVYDFQHIYGDVAGRTYLVNLDGETDTEAIAAAVPAEHEAVVRRLQD